MTAPLRSGVQRRSAVRSVSHRRLLVQAAASFSSGSGDASFDRPDQLTDDKSAADGKAKAGKVASYIFLW